MPRMMYVPLFFEYIKTFNNEFGIRNNPDKIERDFVKPRVSDHSALEVIFDLVNKYDAAGESIKLTRIIHRFSITKPNSLL